jgi:putative transposase
MAKSHIILSDGDHEELTSMLHQSDLKSKVFKRVTALLELHKGKSIEEVRKILGLCYPTMAKLIANYELSGLECLKDKSKPGRPPGISGQQRAAITALACSAAPDGHGRWSLRLLAGKVVELGYCERVSYVQVGRILKKRSEAAPQSQLVHP